MESTNYIITEFEKVLRRDREMAKRCPDNAFFQALAANTEQCIEMLKQKLDLNIRNN